MSLNQLFFQFIIVSSKTVTYQEALDFLYPLHRFGIQPGLDRIHKLLDILRLPQRRLGLVVHLAGTNGKGTVAASLASIFKVSGRKTALYTSPHLVDFTERIRINGIQIPRNKVAYYCSLLQSAASENHATFFEVTTAIAFAWFADEGVDVSIIETGLGGRLDATNVVDPRYVVIPSIGLDHTEWLGTTPAIIAAEKAAIIKKGCKVMTAVSDPESLQPIQSMATLCNVPLFCFGKDARCSVTSQKPGLLELDIRTGSMHYPALQVPLTGTFHAYNITLAVMVAEDAGISPEEIRLGLEQLSGSGYRARLELMSSLPAIFLDVSHNPDGMRETVNTLLVFRHLYNRVFVMLGLASDKDARAIVRELLRLNVSFLTVPLPSDRGISADLLGSLCHEEGREAKVSKNAKEGLAYLRRRAGADDLILITGSFYLAGDIIDGGM